MKYNYIEKYLQTYENDFYISNFNSTKFVMPLYHYHEEYEIYLSLTDKVLCFVGNQVYEVNRGDILIFNNRDVHRFYVPDGTSYHRHIIQFKPEYIRSFSTAETNLLGCFDHRSNTFRHLMHLQAEQFDYLINAFEELESRVGKSEYGDDLAIKIKFIELLIDINKLYHSYDCVEALPSNVMDYRIREMLLYINQNLSGNLSLECLASTFFLSKYHLGYLFKKNTGYTPNEYIILQRIFKAKQLINEGMSVTMCAEQVGYTNQSHFIRMFKKVTGASPKRFMKMKMHNI